MFFPYTLIKYDTERDEPVRGSDGLCMESSRGDEWSQLARTDASSLIHVFIYSFWRFFFFFFCRWNGAAGVKDHRNRFFWRLRPKPGTNGEEKTSKRPEDGRRLLQHRRPDEDRWGQLHLLPGPSRGHLQVLDFSLTCQSSWLCAILAVHTSKHSARSEDESVTFILFQIFNVIFKYILIEMHFVLFSSYQKIFKISFSLRMLLLVFSYSPSTFSF